MSSATSFTTLSDAVSLASTVIDHPPSTSDVSSVPAGQQLRQRQAGLILPDVATAVSSDDDEDDEDEEDEITNHLNDLSIDDDAKDSADGSGPPMAASAAAAALPPADCQVELSELVQRSKVAEDPDTISDESGYSEESNATLSSAGGVKTNVPIPAVTTNSAAESAVSVNGYGESSPPTVDATGAVDLSVKGVLISDFSSSEQLRYLERRSRSRSVSPFNSGQIQPDFCINI